MIYLDYLPRPLKTSRRTRDAGLSGPPSVTRALYKACGAAGGGWVAVRVLNLSYHNVDI